VEPPPYPDNRLTLQPLTPKNCCTAYRVPLQLFQLFNSSNSSTLPQLFNSSNSSTPKSNFLTPQSSRSPLSLHHDVFLYLQILFGSSRQPPVARHLMSWVTSTPARSGHLKQDSTLNSRPSCSCGRLSLIATSRSVAKHALAVLEPLTTSRVPMSRHPFIPRSCPPPAVMGDVARPSGDKHSTPYVVAPFA
jgi:hypothetical protein